MPDEPERTLFKVTRGDDSFIYSTITSVSAKIVPLEVANEDDLVCLLVLIINIPIHNVVYDRWFEKDITAIVHIT